MGSRARRDVDAVDQAKRKDAGHLDRIVDVLDRTERSFHAIQFVGLLEKFFLTPSRAIDLMASCWLGLFNDRAGIRGVLDTPRCVPQARRAHPARVRSPLLDLSPRSYLKCYLR